MPGKTRVEYVALRSPPAATTHVHGLAVEESLSISSIDVPFIQVLRHGSIMIDGIKALKEMIDGAYFINHLVLKSFVNC